MVKIKLDQLIRAKLVNKIYLSTNDNKIISFVKKLQNKKIIIHPERLFLSQSSTMTQKLINHAIKVVPDGHILWTHVTSPFVSSRIYDEVIKKYKYCLRKRYDSLMSITKIKGFIWDDKKSINYNYDKIKWPRTQDIKPLNKINSAIFINSRENYIKYKNRLGKKPFMFELKRYYGLDIDDVKIFTLLNFYLKTKKNTSK